MKTLRQYWEFNWPQNAFFLFEIKAIRRNLDAWWPKKLQLFMAIAIIPPCYFELATRSLGPKSITPDRITCRIYYTIWCPGFSSKRQTFVVRVFARGIFLQAPYVCCVCFCTRDFSPSALHAYAGRSNAYASMAPCFWVTRGMIFFTRKDFLCAT